MFVMILFNGRVKKVQDYSSTTIVLYHLFRKYKILALAKSYIKSNYEDLMK
jgi:hypothetical protein